MYSVILMEYVVYLQLMCLPMWCFMLSCCINSVLVGTWCCSPGICKSLNFIVGQLQYVATVFPSSLQALVLIIATVIQRLWGKFDKKNKQ